MEEYSSIQIIENNGLCRVLIYISNNIEGIYKSEIRKFIKAYVTAEKLLNIMLSNDLIIPKKSTKHLYIPTNKGLIIAEKLKEINDILELKISETSNKYSEDTLELAKKAFKLHLSPALLETWESDWDGNGGSNVQNQHKNRIKKIALKYKETTPEYWEVFENRFK